MNCSFFMKVCLVTFTFVLAIFWRDVFDVVLQSQLRLDPSSTLYKMWVKNPLPIFLEVYLFNLTNANKFERDKNVAPDFKEVGPFVFEETREKVEIGWDTSRETVTFKQKKKWIFLPELSEDISVGVTNLNPIASTIAHVSRLWKSNLYRQIVNTLLNRHEPLLVTASAQQWIFDGIPDEFLEIFKVLRKVTDITIPFNKFGWFYDRNESSSYDGTFTIKTGRSDIYDLGMMVSWNNMTKTEHYESACSLVYGSTGEVMPPLKPTQKSLTVFASDICSYVTLKYSGTTNVEGLDGLEYVGDDSFFDNGTTYGENLCFYLGESCPSGSRNVSSCKFGSPAFISFPHFYLADAAYSEKLTGMNPNKKKHMFSLKVEPKTGVPLAVSGALQINFRTQPYEWCDEFRELPVIYMPMLWFKQTVQMSKEYASILNVVLNLHKIGSYFFGSLAFLFLCLLLLSYKFR